MNIEGAREFRWGTLILRGHTNIEETLDMTVPSEMFVGNITISC